MAQPAITIRHPRKREFFAKLALRGETAQGVLGQAIDNYLSEEDTMITLTNDFHGTESTIRIAALNPGEARKISKSTYNRVRRELCGSADCQCGTVHGPQPYALYHDPNRGYFVERTYYGINPMTGEEN